MATVFRSTDSGAPVLTGEAGSLNALLNACLVEGYGEQVSLGWERAFHDSATQTSCYRSTSLASTQCYLQVIDSTTTYAAIKGFTSMTAHNAGEGAFYKDNMRIKKSSNANSDERNWILIGTSKWFYLFTGYDATHSNWTTYFKRGAFFFGDFVSYRPADQFNCLIHASTNTSANANGDTPLLTERSLEIAVAKDYNQIASANYYTFRTIQLYSSSYFGGPQNGTPYPSSVTNGATLFPSYIAESNSTALQISEGIRGVMPATWYPLEDMSGLNPDASMDDIVGLEGHDVMFIKLINSSTASENVIAIDTSVE